MEQPFDISKVAFGALEPKWDDRNVLFWEVVSVAEKLPSKYFMPYPYISNQWTTPDCTAHSQAWVVNENNWREASNIGAVPSVKLIDPVELWEFWHSIGAITSEGGYINWAFKYLKNWNYISWYSVVGRTPDEIKQAIFRNWALVTWSNRITWSDFLPWWIAKNIDNSPWHAFRIDGWDDEKWAFRITNSWWDNWWDKGFFWVKYSDINLLFTMYAFHDVNDTSALLRAKAKNLKIWSWNEPSRIATRKETVIIGSRVAGQYWTDSDMLTRAIMNKIYDGKRNDDPVSLFEAKTIFSRLGITKSPKGVTRWELVECIS